MMKQVLLALEQSNTCALERINPKILLVGQHQSQGLNISLNLFSLVVFGLSRYNFYDSVIFSEIKMKDTKDDTTCGHPLMQQWT